MKAIQIKDIFKQGSRYQALFLSLLLSAIGFGLYKGVLDNYMAEVVRMNEVDRGLTEFFRELPGLMLVFILAVCYKATAERMYKAGLAIMFVGMVMQAFVSYQGARHSGHLHLFHGRAYPVGHEEHAFVGVLQRGLWRTGTRLSELHLSDRQSGRIHRRHRSLSP